MKKTFIFMLGFVLLGNKQIDKTQSEINKTKQLITQKIADREKYNKKERNLSKELELIDKQIMKIENEKKSLEEKIRKIVIKIKDLENKILLLSDDIEFYKKFLGIEMNNFVLRYIVSNPFYEENLMRKIKKIAMKECYNELQDIKKKKDYSQKVSQEYLQQKEQLEKYKEDLLIKQEQQKNLFAKKNNLLSKIRREKVEIEKEIEELKKTQNSLEILLKQLQEKERKKLVSSKNLGKSVEKEVPSINRKFPRPVGGEIVCKFGKEKTEKEGVCIVRNGVTFQTLPDSDVYCVEDGKIIFVSMNFRTYGKMVIVEHKDEVYSVYGQLGEILVSEGNKVLKGKVIGKTNSDGQVYFELRKNLIPLNPVDYFE